MIKNYNEQLTALNIRKASLKAKKVRLLGELVVATGADVLDVNVIAGILLAAMGGLAPEREDSWRAKGTAFFHGRRKRSRDAVAFNGSGAEPNGDSDQPR